ncbi:MAG TPA: hypothetical protein VLB68_10330 [Pyrinomonadaceae bacterium]|nr:hypothetical protein [Pyrinomonadaceae bacterium]
MSRSRPSVLKYLSVVLLACPYLPIIGTDAALLQHQPPPVLPRSNLPIPPRQYSASQPPQTSLPQTLSTASTKLFEQGLADPRGCEYRQVEIVVHTIWGGAATVMSTHAWLLPQAGEGGQRFIVAWNGLVYPALSVGANANLREDVLAAIETDEAQWTKAVNTFPLAHYRFRASWPEALTVSHTSLLPLKACLLLRLGENLLAEKIWTAWTSHMDPKVNDDALHLHDPYLMLAGDWIWARFERSLCAHIRGDDQLALDDARFLNATLSSIDDAITKRSSLWPPEYRKESDIRRAYFGFLEPVPLLLADQERRLKEGRKREPLQNILGRYQEKSELVTALIQQLDQATAHQSGQPGGVDMSEDIIVHALIKQGDVSVEPLLIVLEQDNRLTRSVSFHRDFGKQRHIIYVYEAAYRALAAILKLSQNESITDWEELVKRGMEGRKTVAARLRTRWNTEKGNHVEKAGLGIPGFPSSGNMRPRNPTRAWSGLARSGLLCLVAWASRWNVVLDCSS